MWKIEPRNNIAKDLGDDTNKGRWGKLKIYTSLLQIIETGFKKLKNH